MLKGLYQSMDSDPPCVLQGSKGLIVPRQDAPMVVPKHDAPPGFAGRVLASGIAVGSDKASTHALDKASDKASDIALP